MQLTGEDNEDCPPLNLSFYSNMRYNNVSGHNNHMGSFTLAGVYDA